jgi:hypothetical protein
MVHSAKVMIEGCKNCKIHLNGKVITATTEVWKCDNVEVNVATKLAMQVDLCTGMRVTYGTERDFFFFPFSFFFLFFFIPGVVEDLVQLVWAGVEDLALVAGEHTLNTGLPQMREEFNGDVNAELDQFIIRLIEGKLLSERIVRLPNGFPTTDREADLFDAEQRKKDAAMDKMARDMIKNNPQIVAGHLKGKKIEQKVKDPKKLKPNEPCHCGSGKKYKKCCMEADEKERQAKKNPERKLRLDPPTKEEAEKKLAEAKKKEEEEEEKKTSE